MKIKNFFTFTKQEQNGIIALFLLILVVQFSYVMLHNKQGFSGKLLELDSTKQAHIDLLKKQRELQDTLRLFPFNPNYLSDYRAYALGMSLEELNRLQEFRSSGKFVNSAQEFQNVTKISDSLLSYMAPYFKFPHWIGSQTGKISQKIQRETKDQGPNLIKQDLNTATVHQLKRIYGIGDKLSARIIKFRDRLGGFLIDAQLYDTYGLEKEVADRVLEAFTVLAPPEIEKININTATVEELSQLIYLQKHVAQGIVDHRNLNKNIESFDELLNIKDFPAEKIDRIKLYLTLKK